MSLSAFGSHLLLAFLIGIVFACFGTNLMVILSLIALILYCLFFDQSHTRLILLSFFLIVGLWRSPKTFETIRCKAPLSTPAHITEWRSALHQHILNRLPGDPGELLAGTLYGERKLSKERTTNFRTAGMTHLVAVSGSNLSIIAAALFAFLGRLSLKRSRIVLCVAVAMSIFVLFVGFQAPVVRAGMMALFASAAPLIGRLVHGPRLLLVSCVLYVLLSPCALLSDASFALSFFATWGLMSYGASLNQTLEKTIKNDTMRSLLAETSGATLMTLPYSAWAFGQVSLLGLISNIFAVPLVSWAMALGTLCLILPEWTHSCLPAEGILKLMLAIADYTSTLPVGTWQNVLFSWPALFFTQSILIFYALRLQKRAFLIRQGKNRFVDNRYTQDLLSRLT